MNQEKINQIPWTEKLSVRVNMVVSYQNGYYRSLTGKNNGLPPEGNQNWTYLGEISRYETVARRDAANIMSDDADAWKLALGLDGFDIDNFMKIIDWTINGKIRADKLESLALSRAVPVAETSIDDFLPNAFNYEFEEGDFIAIAADANPNPNYTLYYYTGNDKDLRESYLKTGFSNITMSMVDGLVDALNNLTTLVNTKLDGPLLEGNFILNRTGNQFTWVDHPVETLQTVIDRGNGTTKPIIFQPSQGRIGELNCKSSTASYWFGNINLNHTGTFNHSFGYNALSKVTTGESNVAVGGFSGKELTDGAWNVFVGVNSGAAVTTGEYNVMIGTEAGKNSTNANSNTFVGDETGTLNTTGFKNTFIGCGAGYNNTVGNLNTVLGYKAGLSAMGDLNTFVGDFAGQGVTGRNNVLIGVGAGNSDGALANKLIIHSNNTLTGYSNTVEGNFGSFQQSQLNRGLITGDFLDRWVRMNANYLQLGSPATNVNDINISPSSGIYSVRLYDPASDNYYIQKGWVSANYYDKTEIESKFSGLYKIMGSVNNYTELTALTGQVAGNVWNLIDTGDNYVYVNNLNNTGNPGWDKLSGIIDTSSFASVTYVDNKFIPYSGSSSGKPITGKLFFRGSSADTVSIFIDYGLQETGALTQLGLANGLLQARTDFSSELSPTYLSLRDSDSNNLNINLTNGITSDILYTPVNDGDFVQKKYVDDRDKVIKPYKSYVCLMQAGGTPTPSPSFVELENSLGAIVWTRNGVGEYFGTLNGAFPINKVVCFSQLGTGNGGVGPNKNIICARLDDDRVFIKLTNEDGSSTPVELTGQWGSLEIRVYP